MSLKALQKENRSLRRDLEDLAIQLALVSEKAQIAHGERNSAIEQLGRSEARVQELGKRIAILEVDVRAGVELIQSLRTKIAILSQPSAFISPQQQTH